MLWFLHWELPNFQISSKRLLLNFHGIIQQINKEAPLILTLSTEKKIFKKIVVFSGEEEEDFKKFQL